MCLRWPVVSTRGNNPRKPDAERTETQDDFQRSGMERTADKEVEYTYLSSNRKDKMEVCRKSAELYGRLGQFLNVIKDKWGSTLQEEPL